MIRLILAAFLSVAGVVGASAQTPNQSVGVPNTAPQSSTPLYALNCNGDFILDQLHGYSSTQPATLATVVDCWNTDGPVTPWPGLFIDLNRSTMPLGSPYNFGEQVSVTTGTALSANQHSQLKFQLTGREIQSLCWGLAGTETACTPQSAMLEGWEYCNSSLTYPVQQPYFVNNNNVRGGAYRSFIHVVSIGAPNTWTPFSFVIQPDTADFWASGINPGVSLTGGPGFGAGTNFQTSTVDAWVTGTNNYVGTPTSTNLINTTGAACAYAGVHFRPNSNLPYQALPYQMEYDRIRHHQWTNIVPGVAVGPNIGINNGEYCAVTPVANSLVSIPFPLPTMIGGVSGGTPGVPTITLFNPAAANNNCRDETANADVACAVTNATVNGFTVATSATVAAAGDKICVNALVDTLQ